MPRPKSDSRQRLIEAASLLLRRHGYQATGMAQIVQASGAPRGSVYFLFPGGKQELAIAAVQASAAEFTRRIREAAAASPDVRSFCAALAEHIAADLTTSHFTDGCPVSTVTLDSTPGSPELAEACSQAYDSWRQAIQDALIGYGVDRSRAARLALLMLTAVEGALLLCRAKRSIRPLEEVHAEIVALAEAASQPGGDRALLSACRFT
ncbi:MAG: TetR/AcrR family transcriptional regulator [Micromonosporaceae bacterium]|nr:TetR/AcrR family transcriptional regulator [Micromonosporaceae bacterium]